MLKNSPALARKTESLGNVPTEFVAEPLVAMQLRATIAQCLLDSAGAASCQKTWVAKQAGGPSASLKHFSIECKARSWLTCVSELAGTRSSARWKHQGFLVTRQHFSTQKTKPIAGARQSS